MNDVSRWLNLTYAHLRASWTHYIVPELVLSLIAAPITFGVLGLTVLVAGRAVVGPDLSTLDGRPEMLLVLLGVFFLGLVVTMIVALSNRARSLTTSRPMRT